MDLDLKGHTQVEPARQEFLKLVRALSYEKKKVTLASGKESDFYIDMRVTLLHPKGAFLASQLMSHRLKEFDGHLKGCGGMTMGADPITTSLSLATLAWKLPLMGFYIRKEAKGHGLGQLVEGLKNFSKGDPVIILEDVVTSGGSSIQAAERAQEAGLKVEGIFTCVDREEGGEETIRKAGYKFYRLLGKSEIV